MEEEEREIEYNSILLNEEPKSPSVCDTSIKCGVCSKDLSSFEVEVFSTIIVNIFQDFYLNKYIFKNLGKRNSH